MCIRLWCWIPSLETHIALGMYTWVPGYIICEIIGCVWWAAGYYSSASIHLLRCRSRAYGIISLTVLHFMYWFCIFPFLFSQENVQHWMSKKSHKMHRARSVMDKSSKLFSGIGRKKTPPKDGKLKLNLKLNGNKQTRPKKLTSLTVESCRKGLASCMAYG